MSRRTPRILAGIAVSVLAVACIYEWIGATAKAVPAPAFSLKDLSGKSVRLADFQGQVVLLDFWGTYCGPCLEEMPRLQQLREELRPAGFEVLGIVTDVEGAPKVAPVVKKLQVRYPILLLAPDTAALYGVESIPALFLVDRKGNLVRRFDGAIEHGEIDGAIRKLVARK